MTTIRVRPFFPPNVVSVFRSPPSVVRGGVQGRKSQELDVSMRRHGWLQLFAISSYKEKRVQSQQFTGCFMQIRISDR